MTEKQLEELKEKALEGKGIEVAIAEAEATMLEERGGEQLGLKCRYNGLNVAMNKYFRFSHVTLIAGASGSGKSYLLNILEDDFFNPTLNSDFKYDKLLLSFKFEMDAQDEVIRTASRKMKKSFNYLISSEYLGDDCYNKLTNEEISEASMYLKSIKSRNVIYFEKMGTWFDILSTIKYHYYLAKEEQKRSGIETKIVVTLDHSLLVKQAQGEKNILETVANLAIAAIFARKFYGCMVIILGQLNSNIESVDRRTKKDLHYPVKGDIYAQAQLYWACDNVFVLHRPELLGLARYGINQLYTSQLAHLICIKSRKGRIGNVWLRSLLHHSTFEQVSIDYFKTDQIAQDSA